MRLEYPFHPPYPPVTQPFAHLSALEPTAFLYPDGTVGYESEPGALSGHYHNGIDYALTCGDSLFAPADGLVVFAGHDTTGFGLCLKLGHGSVMTLFGHQSELFVSEGQQVSVGERVSLSGGGTGDRWRDGNSDGCHLHFACVDVQTGHYRDPDLYLTSTPQWKTLEGSIAGGLTTATHADGHLEALARGTDGDVQHIVQNQPNGAWGAWSSLGGQVTGRVVAQPDAAGRLTVFARGRDGALWHTFRDRSDAGWSTWTSLGGEITELFACALNVHGLPEVVAKGVDGAVWHTAQQQGGNAWTGWQSLGGEITDLMALSTNHDGRLEVLARGADGALWHLRQSAPGNW